MKIETLEKQAVLQSIAEDAREFDKILHQEARHRLQTQDPEDANEALLNSPTIHTYAIPLYKARLEGLGIKEIRPDGTVVLDYDPDLLT